MTETHISYKKVELPNGETLAYQEREGGWKKVLLIHGNMNSSKHWDLALENMDPRYKLFAIDLRGFGSSTYHKPITSIKDFSDDVKSFVDAIGLHHFSIIGWSTGGAVGMQFVADYPSYCEKLVLLASASTRGYPFYGTNTLGQPDLNNRLKTFEEVQADVGKTIPTIHAYETKNRSFITTVWNMLIYTNNQPDEQRYKEYVEDVFNQRNLVEVYQALNIFNISEKHNGLSKGNGLVKKINVPVLVLRGDLDQVVTEDMTKEIMEDLGNTAKFIALTDCGHSPLVDDLSQLIRVITEFLE